MSEPALLPGGILSMTSTAADRLLSSGNGDAALLYLHLLRSGGSYESKAAGVTLKWDLSRLDSTFSVLIGLGLADKSAARRPAEVPPEPDEPPEYTTADLNRELEDSASPFPSLVTEVQRRLGKILSTSDLKTLYSLYDYLALPADVIFLLVSWCVEEMERKYGQGRKPRLSQISREAFAWRRLGLDTPEAAEEYLKKQQRLRTREGAILSLVGVMGRSSVDAERKHIAQWVEMGFDDETIRMAYERTVYKKQAMNWPYMTSILRSWDQKGLHTAAQVEAGDSAQPRNNASRPTAAPPGEADRRAREDMERMRAFMKKQREDDAREE